MSLIRALARPLLAAPIIAGGIDAVRHPESAADVSERAARGLVGRVPQLQALGPDAAVRVNGGLMVASGALLALGRAPRLASLAMVASLIPPILEKAREYKANPKDLDPAARAHERADLLRSAGVLGGALLAVADTAGRPSLGRLAKHATSDVKRELHHAAREAALAGKVATARLS